MKAACLLAMLWPMAAVGQTVFFDDFEGNALLPHWVQPPPSHWEYGVANSRLTVTGLFYPSSPNYRSNWASISAPFEPQEDFRVDAWMGWGQGNGLSISVLGRTGTPPIARIAYLDGILAGAWAGQRGIGAAYVMPSQGAHQFTITRTGAQFEFFLNGDLFASVTDGPLALAAGIEFGFSDIYDPSGTGAAGTFFFDRVQVTPSPSVFGVAVVGLAWLRRRGVRSAA